jgi:hypothetical protein
MWKAGITLAGTLLLLALWICLMVLVVLSPVSAAGAHVKNVGTRYAGNGNGADNADGRCHCYCIE